MNRHCAPFHKRRFGPTLALVALLAATACTRVPELEATIPDNLRNAPYPKLQELDASFLATRLPQDQSQEIEKSLSARRDRLQSRAGKLSAPVVSPQTRKRMQTGVQR